MKFPAIQCDQCDKIEHTLADGDELPKGWYAVTYTRNSYIVLTEIRHVCSEACLVAWAEKHRDEKAEESAPERKK